MSGFLGLFCHLLWELILRELLVSDWGNSWWTTLNPELWEPILANFSQPQHIYSQSVNLVKQSCMSLKFGSCLLHVTVSAEDWDPKVKRLLDFLVTVYYKLCFWVRPFHLNFEMFYQSFSNIILSFSLNSSFIKVMSSYVFESLGSVVVSLF